MGSGYQPLTDDRSIRILTLHPNPDFAAPLECGLCEVSLDPALAPAFHALSYVWGTPAGEEPILCNGDVLPVTKNCAEALRYLRQAKEPVDLWVDALCINQQSVEERGQQVPLMGDIYMAAQKVYIFLGPGSAETRILFRDMHVLFWIFRITRAVKLSLRWQESLISFLGYTGYSAALARIGLGEWFERIWTLQEFVFARDPVLVSGSSQVSIRALCERPDDYYGVFEVDRYPLRLGLTRLWDRITFRDVYYRTAKRLATEVLTGAGNAYFVWPRLLCECSANKATDPRDKVYGILSLLGHLDASLSIPRVDYGADLPLVYETIARHIIRHTRRLDILQLAGIHAAHPGFPSWVPNWINHPGQLEPMPAGQNQSRYCATEHSLFDDEESLVSRQGQLTIRGKLVGVVDKVGSRAPPAGQTADGFHTVFLNWIRFADGGSSTSDSIEGSSLGLFSALALWTMNGARFTLAGRASVNASERYTARWSGLSELAQDNESKLRDFQFLIHTIAKRLQSPEAPGRDVLRRLEAWLPKVDRLADHTLFTTIEGRPGFTKVDVMSGDRLFLVKGIDCPVLVRKMPGDHNCYVGPAHLQGVMQGEQWPAATREVNELQMLVLS